MNADPRISGALDRVPHGLARGLLTVGEQDDRLARIVLPAREPDRFVAEAFKQAIRRTDSMTLVSAAMTAEVEVGAVYLGRVTSIKEFGAFIEILPGTEGMCHISDLADGYVDRVEDVVSVGDELTIG